MAHQVLGDDIRVTGRGRQCLFLGAGLGTHTDYEVALAGDQGRRASCDVETDTSHGRSTSSSTVPSSPCPNGGRYDLLQQSVLPADVDDAASPI